MTATQPIYNQSEWAINFSTLTIQICFGHDPVLKSIQALWFQKGYNSTRLSSLPSSAESEKLGSTYYFKSDICKWLFQNETLSHVKYAFLVM